MFGSRQNKFAPALVICGAAAMLTACGGGGSASLGGVGAAPSGAGNEVLNLSVQSVSVAAGVGYSLAVQSDGSVKAWGEGMSGLISTGLNTTKSVGAGLWTDGRDSSFAVSDSGQLRHWGFDSLGGATNLPLLLSGLGTVVAARSCGIGPVAMVYLLKSDGTVWATPAKSLSQNSTAFQVPGLKATKALSDGGDDTCSGMLAIANDGTVSLLVASNSSEPTGVPNRVTATGIIGLTGIKQASCAVESCLAVNDAGQVLAWGTNDKGQAGNGTQTLVATPQPVMLPTAAGKVKKVMVSMSGTAYAVTESGSLYAWGDVAVNAMGSTLSAKLVLGLPSSPVKDISVSPAEQSHTLVVLGNGQVWGWGDNALSQITSSPGAVVSVPKQSDIRFN